LDADEDENSHLQQLMQAAARDAASRGQKPAAHAASGGKTRHPKSRRFSFMADISEESTEEDGVDEQLLSHGVSPPRQSSTDASKVSAAAPALPTRKIAFTAEATRIAEAKLSEGEAGNDLRRAAEIDAIAAEVVSMRRTFSFFDSDGEISDDSDS
jgi:hypothetical protein